MSIKRIRYSRAVGLFRRRFPVGFEQLLELFLSMSIRFRAKSQGMRMSKQMKMSVSVAAVGLLLAGSAQAQQVVTIGLSAPLTGPQAAGGKDVENGARLAVNDLNGQHLKIGGKDVTFKLLAVD